MREDAIHPDMSVLRQARDPAPPRDIHDARRKWREYAARLARPHPATLAVDDEDVCLIDRTVRVRIYRNRHASGPQPCMLYIHGGGFIQGDLDTSDSIAWGFAEGSDVTVVSVDHRLAPEHPWPAPFDDCCDVLRDLRARADHFAIDRDRIVVGGESSGGHLAAAVAVRSRDEGIRLAGQVIVYGSAGAAEPSDSRTRFARGYGASADDIDRFYRALFGDRDYRADPYAWPIAAADLSGLAPAHVHCAQIDVTRDDGRAYASRLVMAGNDVRYREAKGMVSGFLRARFASAAVMAEHRVICGFVHGCTRRG